MSSFDLILILFVGQVLIFGVGWLIGQLLKIDRYLEETENRSADLTITTRDNN